MQVRTRLGTHERLIMSKSTKRKCQQCNEIKTFRTDQKTCGCTKQTVSTSEREEFLRRKNAELEAQLLQIKRESGSLKELTDSLVEATRAIEPLTPKPYKAGKSAESEM